MVAGDCNTTIGPVLGDLRSISVRAPTFAFCDQQAAEIAWDTITAIAGFKNGSRTSTKPEIWLLMSPTMIAKGVRGTNNDAFRARVTRLYGTRNWLHIQQARQDQVITANQYRDEMTNLMRWRLGEVLGYRYTHHIPMRMAHNHTTIYDMVFATDHYVGDKIMRHLYTQAAQREPDMIAEANRHARHDRETRTGNTTLFDLQPAAAVKNIVDPDNLWQPQPYWPPQQRSWWSNDLDHHERRDPYTDTSASA